MLSCLYCESAAGDLPQAVVYEDAACVAFLDWRQTAPGHVLVVPRRHIDAEELFQCEDGAALLRAAARVAQGLRRVVGPDGLQLGGIVYPAAGLWRGSGRPHAEWDAVAGEPADRTAEDGHFHLHLLPRRHAGEVARIWPFGDDVAAPRRLQELAARIRESLRAKAADEVV